MAGDGRITVGIDIGNSTTEAVVLRRLDGDVRFLAGAMTPTTGIKGTEENIGGCMTALDEALRKAALTYGDVAQIRLNQAAPVISDLSMDTISDTVVIGSAMIGHNPDTPGGEGLATGTTVPIERLAEASGDVVAVVPESVPYYTAAAWINNAPSSVRVTAGICR